MISGEPGRGQQAAGAGLLAGHPDAHQPAVQADRLGRALPRLLGQVRPSIPMQNQTEPLDFENPRGRDN